MEQKELLKQMIDFNKAAFDNSYNAMIMLQDQTEQMINSFLEQASWMPPEGKKTITEWSSSYRKGRESYKAVVDDNFKKVEELFGLAGKGKK
ncbi:MAG: hypothetical protein NT072_04780 [Deltaproteobacteria bacterium]|nr:hypothetical protein [Deltaproteobacteria bacterium]